MCIFLFCALPRHNSNLVSSTPIKDFFHTDIVQIELLMQGHELDTPILSLSMILFK